MITTAVLSSIFGSAILIYIIANAVLWGLEVLIATIRWIFMPKKYQNWLKGFNDVRVLFSRFLLKLNFAVVSPRKAVEITEQQNHVTDKRNQRKLKLKARHHQRKIHHQQEKQDKSNAKK